MNIGKICVVVFALVGCIADLRTGKVSNRVILLGWSLCAARTVTVSVRLAASGLSSLCPIYVGNVLAGAVIPIALGFLLFHFRMIGAGDLKLLSVVGGFTGAQGILRFLTVSVVCGAGISLVMIGGISGLRERMRFFANYVQVLLRTGKVEPYRAGGAERPENFHFTTAILMAALLYGAGIFH